MPHGGKKSYEEVLAELMARGWKQGDPMPQELMEASGAEPIGSSQGYLAGPEGSFDNPMELSTMMVQGSPQAETAPGGVMGPPAPGGAGLAGTGLAPGVFASMSDIDADMYAEMGDLRKQRERADAMRDTADAEGKYVNRGRTFVAASPLEHLVVGAKRWKGKKDIDKIGGKQTKGRRSLIDLLRNKGDEVDTETMMDGPNGSTGFFDIEEERLV